MSGLNVSERFKIRSLSVERLRRRAMTLTLSSPLLRWRYAGSAADQILIVPQELRAADPSFWSEIAHGHFGLASEIADLKGASPFRVEPPSLAWARELHGFGWLRHLAATEEEEAAAAAREYVLEWIALRRMPHGTRLRARDHRPPADFLDRPGQHAARGRRCAILQQIMSSIGQQIVDAEDDVAQRARRRAAHGLPDCARARRSCRLRPRPAAQGGTGRAVDELKRQILDDGGHVSRSASVLADLILDLLPLGQCFHSRGRQPPEEISTAVKKSLSFLRFMRLGDGMLARFNGVSTGSPGGARDRSWLFRRRLRDHAAAAPSSGYARLERGRTIVIADVGSPPPLELVDRGAGRRAVVRDDVASVSDLRQRRISGPRRSRLGFGCARDRQPQHAVPRRDVLVPARPPRAARDDGRWPADPGTRFRRIRSRATPAATPCSTPTTTDI